MKRVFIACAAFATLAFASCNTSTNSAAEATSEVTTTQSSDMAYVSVEAVLAQSEIFKTEGVSLQAKTEKAQKDWAQKEQNLQSQAAKLQEKYQRGLITTANAQTEQKSIERRVASFQSTTQKEMQALDEENRVFSNRTQDLLMRAVKEVNKDKKYKFIINASALIDADTTLNITNTVLEVVNKLYTEEKASSATK